MGVGFYSTNDPGRKRVGFEEALLMGQPADYGLFTVAREDIPRLNREKILAMRQMVLPEVAFTVLNPILDTSFSKKELRALLDDAYDEKVIPTRVQHLVGGTHAVWLTNGPTYSFKDYAARFFGRSLNHFLGKRGLRRTVLVATSGDTGGAVADALHGLDNVDNVVFYPKGSISEGQRRQMTTLQRNVYAVETNGNFDVCQDLAKRLLGDKEFAKKVWGDENRATSANSISVARVLPQSVYPFYAFSRVSDGRAMIVSIPSGNFGDMTGTMFSRAMGLPIEKIVCGVNENVVFPEFLKTGEYVVRAEKPGPSSAMIVTHPSNMARVIDYYGGHIFDKREGGKVVKKGVIDKMPNLEAMRRDIFSVSISNDKTYAIMKRVFDEQEVMLDPHGAVGFGALEAYNGGNHSRLAVVYETADPGKFPQDVFKATGQVPILPSRMMAQSAMNERIYRIESPPEIVEKVQKLSERQYAEAKELILGLFKK